MNAAVSYCTFVEPFYFKYTLVYILTELNVYIEVTLVAKVWKMFHQSLCFGINMATVRTVVYKSLGRAPRIRLFTRTTRIFRI